MILKIIIVLFMTQINTFAFLNNQTHYVVTTHNTPVYRTFTDSTVVSRLGLGTPLVRISTRGTRIQALYNNQEIWVDLNNLSEMSFNKDNFVDESSLFAELPVANDSSIEFVYSNQVYMLNISNLNKTNSVTVEKLTTIPKFSQVSASPDRAMFFLTGDATSNSVTRINLAMYETKTKIFSPITFFLGTDTTIESSEFSPNGKYISLIFSINDEQFVHIYNVETKHLILSKRGILNVSWFGDLVFIYTPNNISYYDSSKEFIVTSLESFTRPLEIPPSFSIIGDEYFIQFNNNVYKLQNDQLERTTFTSLDRSPSGSIQHYQRNGQFITTYEGQRLRSLSGNTPRWTFISILNDQQILYRSRRDALQILNIYDGTRDESTPYYWIEQPYYTFNNGLSIEYTVEDKEIWLFLEKINDYVKILRIPEMLP